MDGDATFDAEAAVQDDARELRLAALLGLRRSGRRTGADAWDESGNPFELKSTTRGGFGTGHHFGPQSAEAWRSRYLVAAFGRNLVSGFKISDLYALHPDDLGPWLAPREERFARHAEATARLRAFAAAGGAGDDDLAFLEAMSRDAIHINNPSVSRDYCRRHGTPLAEPYDESLRAFVSGRPLVDACPDVSGSNDATVEEGDGP